MRPFVPLAVLALAAALSGGASPSPPSTRPDGPDLTTEPALPALLAAGRAMVPSEAMPGLTYGRFALPALGLKVHAWTFDQSRFRMRLVEETSPKGSEVAELVGNGIFAINGGFFERDKNHLLSASGLLIVDGKEVAPENDRAGSGIVYSAAGGVAIGYRKALTDRSAMHDAVQVGPILVDPGGKVGVLDKEHTRERRSAVCLRPGVFIAFAVEGGLSLYQLASLLAAPPAEGGFGCDVAINLDGGPSTQAAFRAGGQRLDISGWPVQNALVISPAPE